MIVKGTRTSDVSQVGKQLVVIENNQKDLGDAIKNLTNEVKDVIATFVLR